MALKKKIETASGIEAEYHRVTDMTLQLTQIDMPQIRLRITTSVYVDQTARMAQKAAATNREYIYDVGLIVSGTSVSDLKAAAYALLKTHNDFVGAEDC